MRAGFPAIIAFEGTSWITTAPAPIIAPLPILIGIIVAFDPIET